MPIEKPAFRESLKLSAQIALDDGLSHPFQYEVFYPELPGEYPLVVFSSGAFSSPDRYAKLLSPIAEAGYVVVSPIHRDAEILALDPKPTSDHVWYTRNAEIAYLAAGPTQLISSLQTAGIDLQTNKVALFGHSYGALIAQLGAGALASDPGADQPSDRTVTGVDALVAYSPPGPLPGTIDAAGWRAISVPSLTVTGTADVLPGFIDDWRDHLVSHEATPKGARWLWVGEEVDHYFGGSFGREGPVEDKVRVLFDHSIATTIAFLDQHLKSMAAQPPTPPVGVTLTLDNP